MDDIKKILYDSIKLNRTDVVNKIINEYKNNENNNINDIFKLILDNNKKYTCLHLACSLNNVDIVRALLRLNCLVNIKDVDNLTPYQIAKKNNYELILNAFQTDLLQLLATGDINRAKEIINGGVDVNTILSDNSTYLHWAASKFMYI